MGVAAEEGIYRLFSFYGILGQQDFLQIAVGL